MLEANNVILLTDAQLEYIFVNHRYDQKKYLYFDSDNNLCSTLSIYGNDFTSLSRSKTGEFFMDLGFYNEMPDKFKNLAVNIPEPLKEERNSKVPEPLIRLLFLMLGVIIGVVLQYLKQQP